jgi:hypothetical protein
VSWRGFGGKGGDSVGLFISSESGVSWDPDNVERVAKLGQTLEKVGDGDGVRVGDSLLATLKAAPEASAVEVEVYGERVGRGL